MPHILEEGQFNHKGFFMLINRAQKKGDSLKLMLVGLIGLLFVQLAVSKPQAKIPLRVLNKPKVLPIKRKAPTKKSSPVQRKLIPESNALVFKKSALAKEALDIVHFVSPVNHKNVKKFKEMIALQEYECLAAMADKYRVPKSKWKNIYTHMTKIRSSIQKVIFSHPLPCVYRNPSLPKSLVDLIESIAIKYGINPKAFHIQIPQEKSADMEDASLYDAWIDAPVVFYQFLGEKLSIGLRVPPVLFIPKSFIQRFMVDKESCLLTLHHELIHLRELNGWAIWFVLNKIEQEGYHSVKNKDDYLNACYKVMERNTDLLALIDDPELSKIVLMKEYNFLNEISPANMNHATFDHFPFSLMIKWHFLVPLVQKCKNFEKVKAFMTELCKEEEKFK